MTVSVIIPTFRRPVELARCLDAMKKQSRLPAEVLITVRDIDQETREFLGAFDPRPLAVRIIDVRETGVIAAMNAALSAATGQIIALTDDDAVPWPDWLERIEGHFADESVAGAGGRDWLYFDGKPFSCRTQTRCGQLNWFGRFSGGHHAAEPGPAYEVVALKGVNCAYRAGPLKSIGFDTRLAGTGAQVHWELSLGLALRRAGWRIIFDPAIAVDHVPAVRFDEDQRRTFSSLAQQNAVANETLILLEHFTGIRRCGFLVWAFFAGTRGAPGLVQLLRLILLGEKHAWLRWLATMRGRMQGLSMYRHSGSSNG